MTTAERDSTDGPTGFYASVKGLAKLQPRAAAEFERVDPSAPLELRRASGDELAEVVSLLNRAYRGRGGDAGWTTEAGLIDGDRDSEMLLRREIDDKPDGSLMVWKPEGPVRACVWLEPGDDLHWYLGSFAVEPRMQDGRIGRRLLTAAEAVIRRKGGRVVKMTVIDSREELLAWYERRGYRRTGETVPFPYSETRFGVPKSEGLRFAVLSKALD